MQFPEKITCHEKDPRFLPDPIVWDTPQIGYTPGQWGHLHPWRSCSYCGSIHPEDLYNWMSAGIVTVGGSDWKYGWPHKFYISGIPNPIAGQEIEVGSTSSQNGSVPIMGIAPETLMGKWYNIHLTDEGFDEEAFDALTALLDLHSGILFNIHPEHGLGYRAPYGGYQR